MQGSSSEKKQERSITVGPSGEPGVEIEEKGNYFFLLVARWLRAIL